LEGGVRRGRDKIVFLPDGKFYDDEGGLFEGKL